jgi:hypothetical protein
MVNLTRTYYLVEESMFRREQLTPRGCFQRQREQGEEEPRRIFRGGSTLKQCFELIPCLKMSAASFPGQFDAPPRIFAWNGHHLHLAADFFAKAKVRS